MSGERKRTLKIDRDVPVPGVNVNAATWKKMKVGDSVLFADRSEANRFAQSLYQATKATAYRQLSRKTADGWRVWKVRR